MVVVEVDGNRLDLELVSFRSRETGVAMMRFAQRQYSLCESDVPPTACRQTWESIGSFQHKNANDAYFCFPL